tara:strand:+ start:4099 stop:4806 length:708 start_codon:yes stop_codon:yes gene_type:complete
MRNYVIIGSCGGIGSQLIEDLRSFECNLVLGYHQKMNPRFEDLDHTQLNAESFESVNNFIKKSKENYGHIDAIINLPGSILLKPPHLVTEDEFDKIINVNLKTSFSAVRAAGKHLDNSSVILISTAAVKIGLANHEAIVASKAGIESIVKSASVTYSRKGLRFNAVAPGLVDTPLSSRIINNPASLELSKKLHITEKIGTANDISNMIKFLIDENNSWITGQTFRVDGGLSSTKR